MRISWKLESKKQFQTGLFIITTNRDGIGEKALNECKITILDDEELFESGKRNWAKTAGKEFSVCKLIHLNTVANFKNFRSKIRKWKKNNNN